MIPVAIAYFCLIDDSTMTDKHTRTICLMHVESYVVY